MVNLKKAAKLIKEDGLFTFIYNEMKDLKKKDELTYEEILELLKKEPKFLEDYKELNTQSEISNIQLRKHKVSREDSFECKNLKEKINENIDKLIALEGFEKEADSMVYVVWIGSLTVFMIFVLHNLIVLYTFWYEHYKAFVFGSYVFMMFLGWLYYKKMIKKHHMRHLEFKDLEKETKELLDKALSKGCLKEDEIYD